MNILDNIGAKRGIFMSKHGRAPEAMLLGRAEAKLLLADVKKSGKLIGGALEYKKVEDLDGGTVFGMSVVRVHADSILEAVAV